MLRNDMTKIILVAAVVCAVSRIAPASSTWEGTISISNGTGRLRVDSVRPIASAVYTLWKRYGLPITYEDARLRYRGDLVDMTAPTYRPKTPEDRAFDPRSGPLDITFTVNSDGRPEDVYRLLTDLLNVYKASGYPGDYVIRSAKGIFNIVPEWARNARGDTQLLSPITDTTLTILGKPGRTNEEVVKFLLASLTAQAGAKVILGKPLEFSFRSAIFSDSASNISARDLLEELSKRSGTHRLWLLLWDPTFKYYVLSIF